MSKEPEKEKPEKAGLTSDQRIKITGIVLPLIATAAFGIVGYIWTQDDSGETPKSTATNNQLTNVTGDNNIVNVINMSYEQAQAALDASPNDELDDFIGAIDGIYEYRQDNRLVVNAVADFNAKEVTLVYANCAVTGPLLQQGKSWLFYKGSTDGVCAFLGAIGSGYPVARVIPKAGSLSNNGRVNAFFIESAEFAVNQFSGFYEWKDWLKE